MSDVFVIGCAVGGIRHRRQFDRHPSDKLNGLSTPAVPFLFLDYGDGSMYGCL